MPKPFRFAARFSFCCLFISLLAGFAVFSQSDLYRAHGLNDGAVGFGATLLREDRSPAAEASIDRRPAAPAQTVTVVDHKMTGGPISETSCTPAPPSKTSFAPTDEMAYQWTSFTGIRANDRVRRDFIQPNGTVFFTSSDTFVSNRDNCAWDAIPIAGNPAASLPGNWQVRVYYNNLLIFTENFTISSNCAYSINPASQSFPASGGNGSAGVNTQAGCAWTATSNASFITITSGSSGNGSGAVNYSVAANPGAARAGTLTIAGQTFTVAQAGPNGLFNKGDVFVAVTNGQIQWRRADGALIQTLDSGEGGIMTGMAFDRDANLYVTSFETNRVRKFSPANLSLGLFGSGYNSQPESIVFDRAGNAYVGQANGRRILKFNAAGSPVAAFAPAIEDRGTDWIELAEDQCTLFYTSEGKRIKRFNVCANTQLADFATGLPGARAYALRLLPGGGLIVGDTEVIVRLDASGNVIRTYDAPGENSWFATNLDPDGTSFWSAGIFTGNVYRFDLATGNQLQSFNTGSPPTPRGEIVGGLVILGELRIGEARADLAITKTASPNPVNVNSNLSWTIAVRNNGPDEVTAVTVTDNLPGGTTFVSCNATGGGICEGTGNNRTITFNSLASGAAATITLVAAVNCSDGATISNTATVVSRGVSDPAPGNNSATINSTVIGCSCPVVETINPTSGAVGTLVTINGRNFSGVNSVRFTNNVAATFTVSGDTRITTTVPNGAISGPIAISKPNCADVQTPVFAVITPPGPVLTTINPESAIAGDPGFMLAAIGANFVPGSIVRWNGAARATTFLSATQLLASIPASDIANDGTASVTVLNPPPGGGVSNALSFTVVACNYAIAPTSQTFNSLGGAGSVSVTARNICYWTATSNDGWIRITAGDTGTGNGTVNFSVTANPGPNARTGTMTIARQTFTVTQAPPDQPTSGAVVIIDGTDANQHGSVRNNANEEGWLYMQKALENLAARVSPGVENVVVDLGSTADPRATRLTQPLPAPPCRALDGRSSTKTVPRPSPTGWPIFRRRIREFSTSRPTTSSPAIWSRRKWPPLTHRRAGSPAS